MAFNYLAELWQPRSSAEHAGDLLSQINAVLQTNAVKDSAGNQIQFAASLGNIVWLLCLAEGNIRADDDQTLLAASEQFSVAQESDGQLLETLPMTGTSLIPGAYSLVTLVVTADSSGATVAAGTKAALGTICNFVTQAILTLGSGSAGSVLCQADVLGPVAVAPGTLTSFTTTVPHVASVNNPAAAVVGQDVETSTEAPAASAGGEHPEHEPERRDPGRPGDPGDHPGGRVPEPEPDGQPGPPGPDQRPSAAELHRGRGVGHHRAGDRNGVLDQDADRHVLGRPGAVVHPGGHQLRLHDEPDPDRGGETS